MTSRVRFTPLAEEDVSTAFGWYASSHEGLGDDFLTAVEKALDAIEAYPEIGATAHRDLRRVLLDRFPYSIYYRLHLASSVIEVRGCIHQKQHARIGRRRA